jgi:hypothetical protein
MTIAPVHAQSGKYNTINHAFFRIIVYKILADSIADGLDKHEVAKLLKENKKDLTKNSKKIIKDIFKDSIYAVCLKDKCYKKFNIYSPYDTSGGVNITDIKLNVIKDDDGSIKIGIEKIGINFRQNILIEGQDTPLTIKYKKSQSSNNLESNFYVRWKFYNNPNVSSEERKIRRNKLNCIDEFYISGKKDDLYIYNCFSIHKSFIDFTKNKPDIGDSTKIKKSFTYCTEEGCPTYVD